MSYVRRAVFVFLVLMPLIAFGQADQAIVSVVDAPDPVVPGNILTYTITFQNNGPNPAVNGGVNLLFDGNYSPTSVVPPPGFTCTALAQVMTCNTPSFAPGAPLVITASGTVAAHLANFPDGTLTSAFTTSGVTADPVGGNNSSGNIVTTYNSPQIDLSVAVTDNPDPVAPDGNITYTVDVTNAGPDTSTSVNFNSFNNGTLQFQSITIPAGWSCPTLPAVGGNPTFTCTNASFAPGTSQFIVVVKAEQDNLGINDGTVFQTFSVNGTGDDTNDNNNVETEQTAYVTPDADVAISVTDSPDPVVPDGNITYTVTVSNNGPDTAPNITLSSFGGNNLRFVSASVPPAWNCTLPPSGTQTTSYSCNLPAGLASGVSSVLTFVMQADDALLGINDQTLLFGFSAHSSIADPVPGNNSETESTAYSTADADLSILASDSPDPVAPDGDITYTVTLNNAGPDSAAATLNVPMNNTLKFTSMITPAGFSCTGTPSAGGASSFSCTDPTFASGETAVFTIVLNADFDAFGNFDQTINQFFGITGNVSDPDNTDNGVTVQTTYDVANANLGITATDAPDPVAAGSNLTYTGAVTNTGPDSATNVTVTMNLASGLLFQSLAGPAGFTCGTQPAVGANGPISCAIASLPNGANLPFTLIVQVDPALSSGPDAVIEQTFLISSATNDPVGANNELDVFTAYTTPDADISVTNSDTPDPVAPGGTITYTQSITNNGPDTAVNATFTQTVPAGTTFQSFAAAAGWTCTTPATGGTGPVNCSKATMLSGETGAFTLVVTVTAPSGSIASQVTGDSDTYDPDTTDNTAGTGTTIVPAINADLGITKSTPSTTAPEGSTITYTIVVTNNGPDTAENVVMTDVLPASLLFQSISATDWSCTTPAVGATGTITCSRATFPAGSSTITLNVTVAPGGSGTVTNTAGVEHPGFDSNSGNATATTPPAPIVPAEANLGITKTTATTSVAVGTVFNYTITVMNGGPSPATNVVVNDTLPAELELVSATPSQGTCNATSPVVCNLGSILNGGSATIALQVRAIATGASVVNSATVVGTESDPATGDNSDDAPGIIVVGGPAGEEENIPTLSEWMLLALMAMLGMVAVLRMRT